MAQKKFSDLSKIAELEKTDILAIERADGTKQVSFKQLCNAIAVQQIEELVDELPEIEEDDTLSKIAGKINKWQKDALKKIEGLTGNVSGVDILDSKEEIEANTESGKAAGAQALKEMFDAINSNLKGFEPVLDDSGKITGYKTDLGGADTVFPFSQMSNIELLYAGHYGNSIYGSTYTYTFKKDYPLVICFNVSAGNNPVSGSIGATLKTGTCKNLASYANSSSETRGLNTACAKIVDAKSNDGITLHAVQLSYGLIVAIG